MESSAFRVLREQVVTKLAEVTDVQAVLSGLTGRLRESLELAVAEERLKLLLQRERNLRAFEAERGHPGQFKQLLHQLDKEKTKLRAEVDTKENAQAAFVEATAGIAASADNLLAYYDAQTAEQKAAILRLLIRRVKLPTNGQRGAAHSFLKAEWVPLSDQATP
jgi:hypothetical protein